MKAVYMGTPEIAAVILKDLLKEDNMEVAAVVTQPDRPKGRGGNITFSEVKEVALEHNIEVYQPAKIKNDEETIRRLKEINPDVIIVVAFGQILTESVLNIPKYGCINVHASLLPKYRGSAPIQWTIINGEEKTGVTIMYMDKGIDTGDMILKEEVPIAPDETGGSLHDKLAKAGSHALIKALRQLEAGTAERIPQNDDESNYVGMLTKSLGHIDFSEAAVKIERLIRGLNPWPSAYTYLGGKTLKLWRASVYNMAGIPDCDTAPGTVIFADKFNIYVKTGEGCLKIEELQLEGKKRMSCEEFLRGFSIEKGTVLG